MHRAVPALALAAALLSGCATGPQAPLTTGGTFETGQPPRYPLESRRAGEQGKTVLAVLVDRTGRIQAIEVRQSSGYRRLDDAAIEAVKTWRFLPRAIAGRYVATWVVVPVVFSPGRRAASQVGAAAPE